MHWIVVLGLAYVLTTNKWAFAAFHILVVVPLSVILLQQGIVTWFLELCWSLIKVPFQVFWIMMSSIFGLS
jgi:hypothetical protein